jgi:hypothetical protein
MQGITKIISTAGHIRLILVGCAPCVANADTFPCFLDIENVADMLLPTLQSLG